MKVVSFFSGIGGLDKGFSDAGFDIVWANDFDKYAVQTYRANYQNEIVLGDINNIPLEEIPDCDVLVGGFPCQPSLGKIYGEDRGDPACRSVKSCLGRVGFHGSADRSETRTVSANEGRRGG